MRKLNRWLYGSGLLFLVMFLSGCVKTGADGQPTGEGFVYNFLVLPMVGRLFLSPLLYGSLFYR